MKTKENKVEIHVSRQGLGYTYGPIMDPNLEIIDDIDINDAGKIIYDLINDPDEGTKVSIRLPKK